MKKEEEEKQAQTGAKGCISLIMFGLGCYACYLGLKALGWV